MMGTRASDFATLLSQLEAEHQREVRLLQKEVDRLEACISDGSLAAVPKSRSPVLLAGSHGEDASTPRSLRGRSPASQGPFLALPRLAGCDGGDGGIGFHGHGAVGLSVVPPDSPGRHLPSITHQPAVSPPESPNGRRRRPSFSQQAAEFPEESPRRRRPSFSQQQEPEFAIDPAPSLSPRANGSVQRHSLPSMQEITNTINETMTASHVTNHTMGSDERQGTGETDVRRGSISTPKSRTAHTIAKLLEHPTASEKARGRFKEWAGKPLDVFMSVVIVVNSVILIADMEVFGYRIAYEQGIAAYNSSIDSEVIKVLPHIDHVVIGLFVMEMVIKIVVFKKSFFYYDGSLEKFHVVDLAVVALSIVEMYVISPLFDRKSGSASVVRLARWMRITRTFRIVSLTKLQVLLRTFVSGFGALGWSVLLLFFFILMGGIFVCQIIQADLRDTEMSQETREWVYVHFGTVSRSTWTMFAMTFSGGWPLYVFPLVQQVSGWYTVIFVVYVVTVIFASLRIATALLIRDTMSAAANDATLMLEVELQEKKRYADKLRSIFEVIDTSGDGRISQEEFQEVYQKPEAQSLMKLLDVQITDVNRLFEILDDGDGAVTFDEFLNGLLRVKGNARAMDVVMIMRDCRRVLLMCQQIKRHFHLQTLSGTMTLGGGSPA